ncbi:hypothetical protein Tco_0494433 [Tanacetum coccineum]
MISQSEWQSQFDFRPETNSAFFSLTSFFPRRSDINLGRIRSLSRYSIHFHLGIIILHLFSSFSLFLKWQVVTTSSSTGVLHHHFWRTSDYFLEKFANELAYITFPPGNDDLPFDAESDLLELEYLLNHDPIKDMDYISKMWLMNSLDDNLDDTISKMFTDEHALNYSSPPLWDDYDDDLFDHESDNDNDFNPPLYELPFHKEFPGLGALLSFSYENEEKFSTLGFSLLKEFIPLFSRNYLIGALKLSKSPKFLKAAGDFS